MTSTHREGEKFMRFVEKKNVYESIVAELKTLIESGVLKCGEKLPSVRAYAVEKKVNPNTVAKAYAVLEEEGYIRVVLKKGAYVCFGEREEKSAEPKRAVELKKQLAAWKAVGVTLAELQQSIEEVYAEELSGGSDDD